MKQFNLLVCGGTFDHFHYGHKAFLQEVCQKGEKVLIGITSDHYIQGKKMFQGIESYIIRKQNVETFLRELGMIARTSILPIDTNGIPQQWEKLDINAIVVSEDTVNGASFINHEREKKGYPPLVVIVHQLIKGADGQIISSSRIRQGVINREGVPFINPVWLKQDLQLPITLRTTLNQPFGDLITDFDQWIKTQDITAQTVITVGDVVTKSFRDCNIIPRLSIIDFVVERKQRYTNIKELGILASEEIFVVENRAGYITAALFSQVKRAMEKSSHAVIKVIGEEDLAALPVILIAPLGMHLFYGQPQRGVIHVAITEEIKERAAQIVALFTQGK